jgi:hypothetical protein
MEEFLEYDVADPVLASVRTKDNNFYVNLSIFIEKSLIRFRKYDKVDFLR